MSGNYSNKQARMLRFNRMLNDVERIGKSMLGRIWVMPYGKERRKLILEYLDNEKPIIVNRHCSLFHLKDQDLKYLLKKGKIETYREGLPRTRYTYIRRKK